MSAARGDRRPCHVKACAGEMRYGRRSDQEQGTGAIRGSRRGEQRGWVCSRSTGHFTIDGSAARASAATKQER